MDNKEKLQAFLKDVQKVAKSVPEIVEDPDSAEIIIIWLVKMLEKLEINFKRLEELKESQENS